MKKKTKKMIVKVVKRSARILICGVLIMTLLLPVYASISASDSVGFVSKPEFNSVLADFNARISSFETGINAKVESAVSTYLNGIDMSGAKGYVINNETEITGTKDATTGVYTNVSAITGIEVSNLKIGDNIYIRDNTAFDYWVSQISPTISLSVLNQKINVADYQKDIFTNVSGSPGELLSRNATELEFISKQTIFDIMRPIYSTFIQYGTHDNPNDLFNTGGITSTWTKVTLSEEYIQLDSTKAAGTTITATEKTDNHTLTIDEMPKHNHFTNKTGFLAWRDMSQKVQSGSTYGAPTNADSSLDVGDDQPHSHNLTDIHPKGRTAVLWERTA